VRLRLGDPGHHRVRGPDQVARGQLNLQPAAPGAAEDRGQVQRAGIDDHGKPLALPERRDAASHVPGGPLGSGNISHRGYPDQRGRPVQRQGLAARAAQ
jgi:hypothetical protein